MTERETPPLAGPACRELRALLAAAMLFAALLAPAQDRYAPIDPLPLGDALPKLFMGSGECDKHWSIIGISGSEWALIAFIAFIVAAFFAARGK